MELSGRPLLDNRLDRARYLRRRVHEDLLHNVSRRLNTLVLGDRGAGKTTLLHQVAGDLRHQGTDIAEIEGYLVSSAFDFVRLLRARLLLPPGADDGHPATASDFLPWAPGRLSQWDGTGEVHGPLDIVRDLASELDDRRRVVLCDEPSPEVAHTIFGRLRDEVWQLPLTWVVAGATTQEGLYLMPPADVFFERVVRLPELTDEEQHELVKLRLGSEPRPPSLEGIRAPTPRELLLVAQAALGKGRDASSASVGVAELSARAASLGRAPAMAFAEVRSLGPVSASDPPLLERLGWTRERATQVLNQLEANGLLQSFSERRERPGRPRKVYRVRELA